jgi:tetratricopeptide (TPR) repeat protein
VEKGLRKAITIDPTDGRAYVSLGKYYLQARRYDEASKVYEDGCTAAQGQNPFIWQAWATLEVVILEIPPTVSCHLLQLLCLLHYLSSLLVHPFFKNASLPTANSCFRLLSCLLPFRASGATSTKPGNTTMRPRWLLKLT